jgi:NAD(P)-dependent dehydrogenase (short-subunit alcohol dehydrogenase family)
MGQMKDLGGKVAVVTGAASGIGKSLASRFAREGMKLVLADLEAGPLATAEAALRAAGADVLAVPTDVASTAAVDELAAKAFQRFGAVHVVCNNAGVGGGGGPIWMLTPADWEWTLNVNLRGVVNGIRAFVPKMIEQREGHVINTASIAGLLSPPMMGPYVATKHAVVAISEVLARDLEIVASPVRVSVLCPGFVKTRIAESHRNRPSDLGETSPAGEAAGHMIQKLVEAGISPDVVADRVVEAMAADRFYILPHPELNIGIQRRFEDILEGRYPRLARIG